MNTNRKSNSKIKLLSFLPSCNRTSRHRPPPPRVLGPGGMYMRGHYAARHLRGGRGRPPGERARRGEPPRVSRHLATTTSQRRGRGRDYWRDNSFYSRRRVCRKALTQEVRDVVPERGGGLTHQKGVIRQSSPLRRGGRHARRASGRAALGGGRRQVPRRGHANAGDGVL